MIAMPGAAEEFFAELGRRHEPLLRNVTGTIRIDLHRPDRTDHRFIVIDHGDLAVSRRNRTADCRLRVDAALFDKIAAGDANALAALLRGALVVEGDLELLMRFQRVLPGRHTPRPAAVVAGGRHD
jgi:ubiquinone biosynthesis protein UbiJ